MARRTAADCLVDVLRACTVDVVFATPGDGLRGVTDALNRRRDEIRVVEAHDGDAAALMACGYARHTGRLGVCIGTSDPGGILLLNGLADASLGGLPVLTITGARRRDPVDSFLQPAIDFDRLYADIAVYSARVTDEADVDHVAALACRAAMTRNGVAHIAFPGDFQDRETAERSTRHSDAPIVDTLVRRSAFASSGDLLRAAAVLNSGTRVAILAGGGAVGAAEELEAIAEVLGAPILKAPAGKTAVPDDSPYATGGLDQLGEETPLRALSRCDTLLLVGLPFPDPDWLPAPGQATAVQIDADPARIGLRHPVDVALVGDTRLALAGLLPHLRRNPSRAFLETAQASAREWRMSLDACSPTDETPARAAAVVGEIGRRLAPNAIVSSDSHPLPTWFARQIPAQRCQTFSLSSVRVPLANGLPYAIAAQVAYPERQSLAFVAGSGLIARVGELAFAVAHRLPIKIVAVTSVDDPVDLAGIAVACGATGYRVETTARCGPVFERAVATPGPVVVALGMDPVDLPSQPLREPPPLIPALATPASGREIA